MTPFAYRDGVLACEGVALDAIACAVGTPVYVYSSAALADAYRSFAEAFAGDRATICYAVKANHNLAVLRRLAGLGAGMDVVSEGELRRALAAGTPAGRIVFSGVGKTRAEMAFALECGILQFNVESVEELRVLDAVARERGRRAPVALRINPDVDADTHAHIATGRATDKFGIDHARAMEAFAVAASLSGIELVGVAVHIGSQILRLEPYQAAFARIADLVLGLKARGADIRRVDVGGGLGIAYRDEVPIPIGDYAAVVRAAFAGLGVELILEPGRRIAGPAGILLTEVVLMKDTPERRFAIVDAGMNDLIRPMLYGAWQAVMPVRAPAAGAPLQPVDVVGPICESTDKLAELRRLPPLAPGDLLAVGAAGAYGAVMASEYNARRLVPEVLVEGGRWTVVRRRPTFEETMALEG